MVYDDSAAAFCRTKAQTAHLKAKLKTYVMRWLREHPSAGPFAVMAALAELASEVGVASDEHQLTVELFRDLAGTIEKQPSVAAPGAGMA